MRSARTLTAGGFLAAAALLAWGVAPPAVADTGDSPGDGSVVAPDPAPAPVPGGSGAGAAPPAPVPEPRPEPDPAPAPATAPAPAPIDTPVDDAPAEDPGTPELTIEVHDPLPELVAAGAEVSWSYLVTNSGDVEVTDIALTDSGGAAIECPLAALVPTEQMVCTVTTTFTTD
ncbi:DUF7507 domain-containing protein [Georgenia sp. Z1344]|uniref:DUF7507 domain-containing protein n=1 Tax=Georgenia sp. Z1344 TaxID=3416706 RepID=UPI003CED408E